MSDESMFSEFDPFGFALEEAEEPFTPPEGEGVLHHAPDFEDGDDFHREY